MEKQRIKEATCAFLAGCFFTFSAEMFYPPILKYIVLARNSLFPAVITHIFGHLNAGHLFVNMLVLFFFGPELETRIGSKRFVLLFLAGGVLAGVAQVSISESGVIGASGAILAVFGCLAVLNPRMRVYLFFLLPIELWMVALFYAWYDIVFLGAETGIAHLAHLIGLGTGVTYGLKLRKNMNDFSSGYS